MMKKIVRKSQLFLKRNSSTILTCVGGVGVVATAVLAVKATPKALQVIEQAKEEKGEDLTKLEVVKVAGPAYIPAVLTGAATLACIFGANTLNKKQQASMMSAYALLDNSYKEYRKKVEDLYGKEVDTHVKNEIVKDRHDETMEADITVVNEGRLFYDFHSGRYFESTIEDVQQAEYNINRKMSLEGYVYLNDFYKELGLDPIDVGYELGWSEGACRAEYWQAWIDFKHELVDINDEFECMVIYMEQEPIPDFAYFG